MHFLSLVVVYVSLHAMALQLPCTALFTNNNNNNIDKMNNTETTGSTFPMTNLSLGI